MQLPHYLDSWAVKIIDLYILYTTLHVMNMHAVSLRKVHRCLHFCNLLYRFAVTQDTDFLEWKKDVLVTAPLYTGLIQVAMTWHQTYPGSNNLLSAEYTGSNDLAPDLSR